jgi:hypothetical protein
VSSILDMELPPLAGMDFKLTTEFFSIVDRAANKNGQHKAHLAMLFSYLKKYIVFMTKQPVYMFSPQPVPSPIVYCQVVRVGVIGNWFVWSFG